MSIVTDLYATLNADAGVRAIVGQATSPQQSKIYPGIAPDGTAPPYITYNIITGLKIHTIPGTSDADHQRIQLDCYQTTYELAQTLGDAVVSALEGDGYQDARFDRYENDTQLHSCVIDWMFIQ